MMARRLLNLVTALSLVLCVAACAAWGRGYWHADHLQYARDSFVGLRMTNEAYHIASARGGVSASWGYTRYDFGSRAEADTVRGRVGPADGRFRFNASTLPWLQYAGGFYQQARG